MKHLFLLSILTLALSSAPIPGTPEGYRFNTAENLKARLDVYVDLHCIDAKNAWPFMLEFINGYADDGKPMDTYVEIYLHFFPLPFHHHSFMVTKAALITYDFTQSGRKVFDFAQWAFNT